MKLIIDIPTDKYNSIVFNDVDKLRECIVNGKLLEEEDILKFYYEDKGEISDGYHTFDQLYHQRAILFATIVNQNKDKAWKSFKHSDGKYCFDSDGEWFIVGIDTPQGSYTYHYSKEYWDMFDCQELECGKEWDGHTEEDVTRLLSLEQQPNRCDSCTHSEEQDGSNCYECVKGIADNFEEQPTSDDEIIKALKAVRTFHNGNYAPQIDEAIKRLEVRPAYGSTFGGVSWGGIYKEKAQPTDAVSREAVIRLVEQYPNIIGNRCSGLISDIKHLPSVTPKIEPSEDCISREAVNVLVDELARTISDERCCMSRGRSTATIMSDILHLPSATPQRPNGHWIFKNDNIAIPTGYYQCSECEEGKLLVKDNFCPNCGSYNGGGEDENNGFIDNYDICNNCMNTIKKFCKELYSNERRENERLH